VEHKQHPKGAEESSIIGACTENLLKPTQGGIITLSTNPDQVINAGEGDMPSKTVVSALSQLPQILSMPAPSQTANFGHIQAMY